MKMKFKNLITSLVSLLLLSSCTTSLLWDATDPEEYVATPITEETKQRLISEGIEYKTDHDKNVFYVKKTILQKSKDYIYRSLGTPITVTLDVTATVVVVGSFFYVVNEADSCSWPQSTKPYNSSVIDSDAEPFIYNGREYKPVILNK